MKPTFRVGGQVTAGNSSGLNDGACGLLLASAEKADELGIKPAMKLVGYAYSGVRPEIMGLGPVPAVRKLLSATSLTMDDMSFIELNEAFAVQCLVFMKEFGLEIPCDARLNPWGGAIAIGHPLASSGPRLVLHMLHLFREHPEARYGLTALCVGLGQGGAAIWENLLWNGK